MSESQKPAIGTVFEGEGVYLGYHPILKNNGAPVWDRHGKEISHHFFVAPHDLIDPRDNSITHGFNTASRLIGNLRDLFGHHGMDFWNNRGFIKELTNDRYNGEWRPPSIDILTKLHDVKNIGEFEGSFATEGNIGDCWYGSSSSCDEEGGVWEKNFNSGKRFLEFENFPIHWRPVRSVPSFG